MFKTEFNEEKYNLSFLCNGGDSSLFIAEDKESKEKFVLKCFLDYSEIAENEAKFLKRLSSDYVVKMIGTYRFNGKKSILMEYSEIGDLKRKIIDKSLSSEEKEDIFNQLLEMYQFLLVNDFLHRDLNPANILLFKEDGKYHPKICDLGRGEDSSKPSGGAKGTACYLAPEEVKKDSKAEDISFKTDAFSFGCIVYELFTGEKFFNEQFTEDIDKEIWDEFINSKVSEFKSNEKYPILAKSVVERTVCYERKSVLQEHSKSGGKCKVHFYENIATDRIIVKKRSLAGLGYLVNEAVITHSMNFKSVPQVIDFSGDKYLLLDYIPGVQLDKLGEVMKKRDIECFKIMYGVMRTIKQIADLGYAHRNISASDILVDFNYEPHIIDFGEAKFKNQEDKIISTTTPTKGHQLIIPPEGRGYHRMYSIKYYDIYSFSVTMAIAFTDQNSFSNEATLQKKCGEEIANLLIVGMSEKPEERGTPDQWCEYITEIAQNTLYPEQFSEFMKYKDFLEYPMAKKYPTFNEFTQRKGRNVKQPSSLDSDDLKVLLDTASEYRKETIKFDNSYIMGWRENIKKLEKMKRENNIK